MKVSSTFSKVAGCRGRALARAPQSAEPPCAYLSAGGGLRGNPRRGFPLLFFAWYVCAVLLGGGRWPVLRFDPISLVLAQRNGVEPPKKGAFLPRCLHHPRERCCLGCLYSSSPDLGRGAGAVFLARSAFKSFVHLFKGGGVQGAEPLPALRRARNSPVLI